MFPFDGGIKFVDGSTVALCVDGEVRVLEHQRTIVEVGQRCQFKCGVMVPGGTQRDLCRGNPGFGAPMGCPPHCP